MAKGVDGLQFIIVWDRRYTKLRITHLSQTTWKHDSMKHMKINIGIEEKIVTFVENGVSRPVGVNIVKAVLGDKITRVEEGVGRDD